MPTIDEIARLANVSPATVSKVLNNRPYVSTTTRERVERVIAETGFVPSQRARGLSKRRSYILGLVVPYTSDQLFADPHLLEIVRGIEAETNPREYNLLLSTARAADEAASAMERMLRSDVIDGAIVVETLDMRAFTEALGLQQAPWIVIGYGDAGIPSVHADDYGGARQATRHLLDLGHRRIGVVTSIPRPFALDERLRGMRDTLAEAGLSLAEDMIVSGDFSTASGLSAGRRLLERPNRPTAIFALNDRMAFGVIQAAQAMSLGVPADLAVVGFDDIAQAALTSPALTTVRQPGYAIGVAATRLLFALIDGAGTLPAMAIPTELIVRHSAAPPRPERG
jgi:DNA-binding LacI/PurR family transcriptional regulator